MRKPATRVQDSPDRSGPVVLPALSCAQPGLDLFFARVARADRRILLLDSEHVVEPLLSRRREETARLLREGMAAPGVRVAIVSRRPARHLEWILEDLHPCPEVWGCDGSERLALAEVCSPARPRGGRRMVERVGSWVRTLRSRSPVPDRLAGSNRRRACADGRAPGVRRRRLIRRLMAEAGPDAAVALLGDGTSEQAFAELLGRGLSGLVSSRRRASHADIWIRPPEELWCFLERWRDAVRSPKAFAKAG